jgi:lipopolysaccharide transport protein LptA
MTRPIELFVALVLAAALPAVAQDVPASPAAAATAAPAAAGTQAAAPAPSPATTDAPAAAPAPGQLKLPAPAAAVSSPAALQVSDSAEGSAAVTVPVKTTAPAAGSAGSFKPSGKVTVNGEHLVSSEGNAAVFVGNVVVTSDTLKIDGDRLEVKKFPDRHIEATVTGNPAHLAHAGTGPDNPPVTAHAKTVKYNSQSGIVDLNGEAEATRGDDKKITAETIDYNIATHNFAEANGSVKIIYDLPPEAGGAVAPTAPAAAPPQVPVAAPAPAPSTTPATPLP